MTISTNPCNPTNGLPMIDDDALGVDVMGNPYGMDFSSDVFDDASAMSSFDDISSINAFGDGGWDFLSL
jgi:hypothetical protein